MAKSQNPSEFFEFPAKRIGIPWSSIDRKVVLSDATHR
jgi:hypothetical protein